jgi:hypothetical protein
MRAFEMKHVAITAVLMMLAVPAFAHHKPGHVTLAKTTADQRALAQAIAGRIQTALDAEPFKAEKDCKGQGCTASAQ